MNSAHYITLRDKVTAKAARNEKNAQSYLDLAIGIKNAFKQAVPLTGALDVGSVKPTGEFVADDFDEAPGGKMNFAVRVKFKDADNKVVLESITKFEAMMNGADFDVVCVPTGKKAFVMFDDRLNVPALRPVVDLLDEPLSKAVSDFENS